MNYGLYVSASGAAGAMYRLDVAANNLANVNTIGFKRDRFVAAQRDPERVEDGLGTLPSNALLERLGGGILMAPNRVSFEQGPLQTTNDPFDVAIEGPGFLVLRDGTHQNTDRVRLTRDGRLSRDSSGRLVSTDGMPVLDVNNRSITLGEKPVSIDAAGAIRQDGRVVARIQLVEVPDPSRLIRLGHGAFQAPSDALQSRQSARGTVRQGMLESAAVDPIEAMMDVSGAAADAERNVSMIQQHDRLMDRAVNVLGRVA